MLVLNRFVVPPDTQDGSPSGRTPPSPPWPNGPGTLRAADPRAGRPAHWTLVTEWESVGAYRRALGGFDVKVHATPLLSESLDEPSGFETLASAEPGGGGRRGQRPGREPGAEP
jgi:hypothetical protein